MSFDEKTSVRARVLWLIAAGIIGRLILASTLGLGVDESYAVAVARPLSLSYFDHPPLAFWIAGGMSMVADHRALLLRLPFILFFAGTTWLIYKLGARLFGERAGALGAVLLNLAPVFSLSSGSWVLPDGPLLFFMAATTLCLAIVLFEDVARPTLWWLAIGFCTGCALLSKYHAVFLLFGAFVFLCTSPSHRRWLKQPGPYLGILIALLFLLPVVGWNARHGWVSFRFQAGRASATGIHIIPVLQSLAGQAGYLLPWIWAPLILVLYRAFATGRRAPRSWFLACMAIGPIGAFTLAALGGNPGLPHWTAPGYLMLFPLLGTATDRWFGEHPAGARSWVIGSAAAFLLLTAIAATQGATGWLGRVIPSAFRHGDPTLDLLDWRPLRVALAHEGLLAPGRAVAATSWIEAGKAGAALEPEIPVLCLCDHPHHFAYSQPPAHWTGADVIVLERRSLAATVPNANDAQSLAQYFDTVTYAGPIVLLRQGQPAVTLDAYLGRGLRPSNMIESR